MNRKNEIKDVFVYMTKMKNAVANVKMLLDPEIFNVANPDELDEIENELLDLLSLEEPLKNNKIKQINMRLYKIWQNLVTLK